VDPDCTCTCNGKNTDLTDERCSFRYGRGHVVQPGLLGFNVTEHMIDADDVWAVDANIL
jgi:hypothetical protein